MAIDGKNRYRYVSRYCETDSVHSRTIFFALCCFYFRLYTGMVYVLDKCSISQVVVNNVPCHGDLVTCYSAGADPGF